ncbi:hypothetical protein [Virgibacillus sp. L01]|uniref:hypothetical protein n=1 Tax=Virgibacillus sp. L01 TaxID=3457429 RepID=UPI003FD11724
MSFSEYDLRLLSELSYKDLTKMYIDLYGHEKVNNPTHVLPLEEMPDLETLISPKRKRDQWELILTLQGIFHQGEVTQPFHNEYLDAFLFRNVTMNKYVIAFRGTNFSIFQPQFWRDMAENLNPLFLSNKKDNRQIFHAINFVHLVLQQSPFMTSNFNIQAFIEEQDKSFPFRTEEYIVVDNLSLIGHSKGGGLVQKVIYYFTNYNVLFSMSTTFCAPPLIVTNIVTRKGDIIPFKQFVKDFITLDYYKCINYSVNSDRVIFVLTRMYVLYVKGILLKQALKNKEYKKLLPTVLTKVELDFASDDRIIFSKVKSLTRHRIGKMFDRNFDKNGNLKSRIYKYFL